MGMVGMHHVLRIIGLLVLKDVDVCGAGCEPGFTVSVIIHPDPDRLRSIVKEEQNIVVPDDIGVDLKKAGLPKQNVRCLRILLQFKCRNQLNKRCFRIRLLVCVCCSSQHKHCKNAENQSCPFFHGGFPPHRC